MLFLNRINRVVFLEFKTLSRSTHFVIEFNVTVTIIRKIKKTGIDLSSVAHCCFCPGIRSVSGSEDVLCGGVKSSLKFRRLERIALINGTPDILVYIYFAVRGRERERG